MFYSQTAIKIFCVALISAAVAQAEVSSDTVSLIKMSDAKEAAPIHFDECVAAGQSAVDNIEIGTLTLGSGKNTPLNACITIDGIKSLEGVKVEMGSASDFQNHQIAKEPGLDDVELALESQADKGAIIRLSSENPVKSEQVSFVVKLLANNHYHYGLFSLPLLEGFENGTRLITSNLSKLPASKPEEPETPDRSTVARLTILSEEESSTKTPPVEEKNIDTYGIDFIPGNRADIDPTAHIEEEDVVEAQTEMYNVKKGDSISQIATELLPLYSGNEDMQSLMTKIVELNPGNFINNDINLLRADLALKLPEQAIVVETGHEMAVKSNHMPVDLHSVYKVRKNDSLSEIAWKLKPDYPEYSSWWDLMTDLADMNPKAFIEGDINQLRADVSLLIPSPSAQIAMLEDYKPSEFAKP